MKGGMGDSGVGLNNLFFIFFFSGCSFRCNPSQIYIRCNGEQTFFFKEGLHFVYLNEVIFIYTCRWY
jgi:hypothetical protein